jgi:hypothetical protein
MVKGPPFFLPVVRAGAPRAAGAPAWFSFVIAIRCGATVLDVRTMPAVAGNSRQFSVINGE